MSTSPRKHSNTCEYHLLLAATQVPRSFLLVFQVEYIRGASRPVSLLLKHDKVPVIITATTGRTATSGPFASYQSTGVLFFERPSAAQSRDGPAQTVATRNRRIITGLQTSSRRGAGVFAISPVLLLQWSLRRRLSTCFRRRSISRCSKPPSNTIPRSRVFARLWSVLRSRRGILAGLHGG